MGLLRRLLEHRGGRVHRGLHPPAGTPPTSAARSNSIAGTYIALFRRADVRLAVLCSYIGSMSMALGTSFYPILVADGGHGSEITGWVVSARGLGSMLAGLTLTRFVRSTDEARAPLIAGLMSTVPALLSGLFVNPWLLCLFLFFLGMGTGMMAVYNQVVVARASTAATRGSALAMPGMSWALGFFITLMVTGMLKDTVGLRSAFVILGTVMVLVALCLPALQRRAATRTREHLERIGQS